MEQDVDVSGEQAEGHPYEAPALRELGSLKQMTNLFIGIGVGVGLSI
jgi:hypothetical protein